MCNRRRILSQGGFGLGDLQGQFRGGVGGQLAGPLAQRQFHALPLRIGQQEIPNGGICGLELQGGLIFPPGLDVPLLSGQGQAEGHVGGGVFRVPFEFLTELRFRRRIFFLAEQHIAEPGPGQTEFGVHFQGRHKVRGGRRQIPPVGIRNAQIEMAQGIVPGRHRQHVLK